MMIIIILDSTFLFYQADSIRQETFDRDLAETAKSLSIIFKKSSEKKLQNIDENSISLLLTEPHDKMFYSIRDDQGQLVFGDPNLNLRKAEDIDPNDPEDFNVYFSKVKNESVRVVSIPIELTINNVKKEFFIQVAETRNQRTELQHQIIFWILIPQFILLISALILVRFAVKRGLSPILFLNEKIIARSYKDLKPIDVENVPLEVDRLVGSINNLMGELDNAIKSENRFVNDAAHQLRTPLAGILAQIQLAQESNDPEEIHNRLKQISNSSKRLMHIINQLLSLSKTQPEAMHSSIFVKMDLVSLTKKAIEDLFTLADLKKIDLGYEGLNKSAFIMGDEEKLYDLIHNLIENAIKYTPPSGKVNVSIEPKNNKLCLIVEDTGKGIPKGDQPNIFKRFYRGDNVTQSGDDAGAGIGLAIVKEIANMHDATIEIDSRNEKSGTRFYIYFNSLDA
ncbi:MAG: sensor histidine kinase [Gammaproteobacteria bacterium]|nr:sensor histidine kinase [Gammaproteobacteria bacterium]